MVEVRAMNKNKQRDRSNMKMITKTKIATRKTNYEYERTDKKINTKAQS